MGAHVHLLGTLLAVGAGWAFVHHARGMIRDGVQVAEGGGYTAVLMSEMVVWFAGLILALS